MSKASDKATFTTDDHQSAVHVAETNAAKAGTLPENPADRADYLRREADRMIAEAAQIEARMDLSIASHDLTVENEVGRALNAFSDVEVTKPQSGYRYAWVFRDPNNQFGGAAVRKMQALKYEIVRGDMPEALEHRAVTGERWVADCLLMRISLEKYAEQQINERHRRLALQASLEAPLRNLADRAGVRVLDLGEIANVGNFSRETARGEYNRRNANGAIDRAIKQGTLSGAPAPGVTA